MVALSHGTQQTTAYSRRCADRADRDGRSVSDTCPHQRRCGVGPGPMHRRDAPRDAAEACL